MDRWGSALRALTASLQYGMRASFLVLALLPAGVFAQATIERDTTDDPRRNQKIERIQIEDAGNRIAEDNTSSFSTPAACPCTMFTPGAAPGGTQAVRDAPLEVGVKFRSDEDGFITHLRFYKNANNTGTHVGHLWTADGQLLAAATFV